MQQVGDCFSWEKDRNADFQNKRHGKNNGSDGEVPFFLFCHKEAPSFDQEKNLFVYAKLFFDKSRGEEFGSRDSKNIELFRRDFFMFAAIDRGIVIVKKDFGDIAEFEIAVARDDKISFRNGKAIVDIDNSDVDLACSGIVTTNIAQLFTPQS